jgi:hypothetical protein
MIVQTSRDQTLEADFWLPRDFDLTCGEPNDTRGYPKPHRAKPNDEAQSVVKGPGVQEGQRGW